MMIAVFIIGGMIAALGVGVYVGLGAPGMPGRVDRVVEPGRARRLKKQHIDLLKSRRR
jgi:Uri superfamily endonuclease